jgi:hypothetical protein
MRLLLQGPWLVLGLSLIVPCLNRMPVNPHTCGIIAVPLSSVVLAVVTPEGRFPEWAIPVDLAGLAALMIGSMLRGYDKGNMRDSDGLNLGQ